MSVRATLSVVLVLTTACSGRPALPSTSPAATATAAGAPAPVHPVDRIAFDFAAPLDASWSGGGTGYVVTVDTTQGHGGAGSLRFERTGDAGPFAAQATSIDVARCRNKTVRVSAWIRTENADGWAGLWVRADGDSQPVAFANTQATPATGTATWTRYQAEIDVPEAAQAVLVGALHAGGGRSWVDDLVVELEPVADRTTAVAVVGRVVDARGAPLAGMTVSLVPAHGDGPAASTTSGPDGGFRLAAAPGTYGATAVAADVTAGYVDAVQVRPGHDLEDLVITAGGDGAVLSGRVSAGGAPVASAWAGAARNSSYVGDLFVVRTDADGRYRIKLPAGTYRSYAGAPAHRWLESRRLTLDADQVLDLALLPEASLLADAPEPVIAWLRSAAIALASPEAGNGYDDIRPLGRWLGKARVVALGEATHGTREFFQIKHRILEYLVAEKGFTVFAIEANLPEAEAVNDYVLTGRGDPKKALAGMYFWTWNTEEVLAMIEWMRAWNADPRHRRKVTFYGVDMQVAPVAVEKLLTYLGAVDPAEASTARGLLAPLATADSARSGASKAGLRDGVAALIARLDRHRKVWSKKGGARAWLLARRHAVIVEQFLELSADGNGGYAVRDRAMADNLRWIADEAEPGARVVLWAHNGHVSKVGYSGVASMGVHLERTYGDQHIVVGFAFGDGSFQAVGGQTRDGVAERTVGPPPAGSFDATLRRTGLPLLALDLRSPPRGVVADWLRASHVTRQIGAFFNDARSMEGLQVLPDEYDIVFYVDRTTRARPVQR